METEDRQGWRRQLRDALRPDAESAPLSRRARRADVVLAVLLTVVALTVATRYPGDGPDFIRTQVEYGAPVPPPIPPAGMGEAEGRELLAPWPLVVLTALPLAARRRYPLATFGVVLGAALAIGDKASWINVLTCVIGAYSAAMYSRYRARATAGLVVAAALAGLAFRETEPVLPGWSSPAVVLLVAGALASTVRFWQRRLAASRDRLTRLQREQEDGMRRAVEEERARIAAELHDVVTHNVSVMVIQAGAARKVMDAAPERSKEALLAVEAGGRAAMAELRHVMGLLAPPADSGLGSGSGLSPGSGSGFGSGLSPGPGSGLGPGSGSGLGPGSGSGLGPSPAGAGRRSGLPVVGHRPGHPVVGHRPGLPADGRRPGLPADGRRPDGPLDGLEPQPGLGQLDALIERVRAAGTPVSVAVSLPPDPLPPGVDLAAYRVVQEALTNTIKHAPGADAAVTVGYAGDVLEIEVINTAATRPPADGNGNGRGLIGLRERLAVYGGELTAGPTLAGGYQIRARVPWRTV
ncbi:sensor histidine kinase [Streptomyces sp. NPDC057877]|uniref:sensor histidine kinase n=1 Tax=Streptomyces sp. NPDC057877 TaxID=3346269 RepID=UPI0036783103